MDKLISVIIPVKNGAKYIEDTIRGILSQHMNVEIIVVNDASNDDTVAIASSMGCKVISHEVCKGQVAGKNTGLKAASGEYVMFHDADDVMRDGALRKLYEEMESDKSVSAVMAQVQDFFSPELSADEINNCVIKQEPYFGLFTGAVLIKKTVFDAIGLFDESINTGEIISWKLKMEEKGLFVKKIDFVSTDRRVHSTNFGRTSREKEFKDYASVLRARLTQK